MGFQRSGFVRAGAAGLLFAMLFSAAGCGRSTESSLNPLPQSATTLAVPMRTMPIKHIVIVVQENRSFDNFFATYPGATGATTGVTHEGKTIRLTPITFSAANIDHQWVNAMNDWDNGKLDGFDVLHPVGPPGLPPLPTTYAYSYVKPSLVAPYWDMAKQYVLADHMFADEFGPSFIAHQTLIRGTTAISSTQSVMDEPSADNDCDAPAGTTTDLIDDKRKYYANAGPFPCFTATTIADSLDAGNVSWKYYNSTSEYGSLSVWDAFMAIKNVRFGADFANVLFTQNQILTDAKAGNLPGVSWVIPDTLNSDHPEIGSDTGPSWVGSVVNAIGEGPDWNSTAIIVLWDDWGGWYDNVPPPQLDYAGLGFRVPCIIISPYAKKGYIAHTRYEFASVLKTVEQVFGVASIKTRDVRSSGMLDAFDFTKPPRAFVPFKVKYPLQYFLAQPRTDLPVDRD